MATVVYLLCFATSAACALLLARGWARSRVPLLGWSALCFVGLALNNVGVIYDLVLTPPELDYSLVRKVPTLLGIAALLFGLVWEKR